MTNHNASSKNRSTPLLILALAIVPILLMRQCSRDKSDPSAAITAEISEYTTSCFREHFPLVFGIPASSVPPEVKLYCARRWDIHALASVESAAAAAQFEITGVLIRATSGARRKALEQVLPLAQDQAAQGPPNMLLIWRIHKMLPLLYGLQKESGAERVVAGQIDPDDLQRARKASEMIDWDKLAEVEGVSGQPPMRLRDLSAYIVNISAGS